MVQIIVAYKGKDAELMKEILVPIGKTYGADMVAQDQSAGITEFEFVFKDSKEWGYASENAEQFIHCCDFFRDIEPSIESTDIL